jgi:hypothetical protein
MAGGGHTKGGFLEEYGWKHGIEKSVSGALSAFSSCALRARRVLAEQRLFGAVMSSTIGRLAIRLRRASLAGTN